LADRRSVGAKRRCGKRAVRSWVPQRPRSCAPRQPSVLLQSPRQTTSRSKHGGRPRQEGLGSDQAVGHARRIALDASPPVHLAVAGCPPALTTTQALAIKPRCSAASPERRGYPRPECPVIEQTEPIPGEHRVDANHQDAPELGVARQHLLVDVGLRLHGHHLDSRARTPANQRGDRKRPVVCEHCKYPRLPSREGTGSTPRATSDRRGARRRDRDTACPPTQRSRRAPSIPRSQRVAVGPMPDRKWVHGRPRHPGRVWAGRPPPHPRGVRPRRTPYCMEQ